MSESDSLKNILDRANGGDPALDARVHAAWGDPAEPVPPYTESVDACLALIHRRLPDWHWHVGRGVAGILPYARLSDGTREFHADGPTVPLALLRALAAADPV